MSGEGEVREGMEVYDADGELIGRVQRVHDGGLDVVGWHYDRESIVRVENDRVHIRGIGTTNTADSVEPSGDTGGAGLDGRHAGA